jgi:prophage regulatory protein
MTFLPIAEVSKRTSLSKPTIYRRIKDGSFPKPVSTGLRNVAWLDSEIDEWMMRIVEASRAQSPAPCSAAASR